LITSDLWIVLVGNPANGYTAYGTYSSPDEAYATHSGPFTLLRLHSKAAEEAREREEDWRDV
jgi:hypothetical protein